MVNLTHYPNPVRLFSQTRNTWFKDLIESFGVPIHVFTNIRDTQLGQLFFAIEVMRMKKIRSGEDAGPSIFENETSEDFIPVFQTLNQFTAFLEKEEVGIDLQGLKTEFLANEHVKFIKSSGKTDDEWFATLDTARLDELYIPAAKILLDFFLPKIDEALKSKKKKADVFDKITESFPSGFDEAVALFKEIPLLGKKLFMDYRSNSIVDIERQVERTYFQMLRRIENPLFRDYVNYTVMLVDRSVSARGIIYRDDVSLDVFLSGLGNGVLDESDRGSDAMIKRAKKYVLKDSFGIGLYLNFMIRLERDVDLICASVERLSE